jgi:poly(hydroxyalkanoate) depolymerase family esterase
MKPVQAAAAAALVSLCLIDPALAVAGTLHDRTLPASGDPESRERRFKVYVPDGLPSDGSAPLVTVLHGCRQTEANMVAETRFTDLADAHDFAVAFPFVTSIAPDEFRIENCWGFWLPEHRTEGSGEVDDIRRIIRAVETEFGTDPSRRYVAGLSSGAAMAVAVAVAYSEDIAAAGAVAGLPYGENSTAVTFLCGVNPITNSIGETTAAMAAEQAEPEERRLVPLMVVHSINDCTVSIVNGRNLRDSWITYYDALPEPEAETDCMADGVSCTRTRFTDAANRTVVETVIYTGKAGQGTHYWPGDNPGIFANPDGPSASEHLWSFFQDKSLDDAPPAVVEIADISVEAASVTVSGTAAAEAGVTEVHVALEGTSPQAERAAMLEGDLWSATFEEVAPDAFYTPVITAALGDGREVTLRGVRFAVGTPVRIIEEIGSWQQHLAAERIAVPGPNCANALFGVCDRDFTALFFEHGFAPFRLYSREGSGDWFADPEHASSSG